MPRKSNYPNNPGKLSAFIIEELRKNDLTVNALAAETGISQTHLSDIVNEKYGPKYSPKADTLNKLADYFQVARIYLYSLVGWINYQEDDEQLRGILGELGKKDPLLDELLTAYINAVSDEDRKKLRELLKTG